MEYYIQGNAANAEQIRAAFKAKGISDGGNSFIHGNYLYFSEGGEVDFCGIGGHIANIIKTHPGYQELELLIEPNFKAGDWLVYKDGDTFCGGLKTAQVQIVEKDKYIFTHGTNSNHRLIDNECRLWSIADAKDGDVLVSRSDNPFIYNGNIEFLSAGAYIGVSRDGKIRLDLFPSKAWTSIKDVKPATNEQRVLLFKKIQEAGYQWYAGKKELRKIIESRFKVGDWVVKKDGNTFYGGNYAEQITLIEVDEKGKRIWLSSTTWIHDDDIRLWTIADAKDGDVLATDNGWTCIFQAFDGCVFSSYCFMDSEKWFFAFGSEAHTPDSRINGNIHPATKEQRGQLFAKIKEAGYEWDEEKKELRKIQPHYDITNFYAGMPVLVRDFSEEIWQYVHFSNYVHYDGGVIKFWACGHPWIQCIPFEDNKHLLGTTDPCGKEYINWKT